MTIIRLDDSYLDRVIDLHHRVISGMAPGTVASETDQFFADHMADCGQIFGAFERDRLIAYSVLGLPRPGDPNFGVDHGFRGTDLLKVAHIDGVGVLPEFRGQSWHRRMIDHRLAVARSVGRSIALSTVAPGNLPSVKNLLSAGLKIVGLMTKFGGDRFLVRADLNAALSSSGGPETVGHWCGALNRDACKALIGQGLRGVVFRMSEDGNLAEIGWRKATF